MDEQRDQGNLLLAIALSLLVFVGWGWFQQKFAPPPPPPAEEAPAPAGPGDETAVPIETGPAAAAPTPVPATPSIVETVPVAPAQVPFGVATDRPVMDATVESSVLRATFSTRGAVVESVRLVQFPSKAAGQEGPVELVPHDDPGEVAEAVPPTRALDLLLPDGRRLQDAVFELQQWSPGDAALVAALAPLETVFAQPAAPDPGRLREQCTAAVRAAGANPAMAWALAAAATDVPLSKDGELQQGWSAMARANQADLAAAHVLDFRLPLGGGTALHKVYIVSEERYRMELSVVLVNGGQDSAAVFGDTDTGYALVWGPGVASSERQPGQDLQEFAWFHQGSLTREKPGAGPVKAVRNWLAGRKGEIPPPLYADTESDWFALRRKYFMVGVRPMFAGAAGALISLAESRAGLMEMRVGAPPLRAGPGDIAAHHYVLCPSPIRGEELAAVGHGFEHALHFGFFDLFGRAMLAGLLLFDGFLHSYGLAIILLTVLVRLALYPLNQRSFQSMRAMGVLQPKIAELREKYKNDPQEMNKRTWELYREHNVNPLGGCLPIVFQMPVFLALFNALRGAIELRGADFLWIADLSEPDRLAELPRGMSLNILPLLMIGAMIAQQKMSTPPANPTNDPNIEMQRKMMTWMPLMFGLMFYGMPSGLTLYWLVSTLLGIGQQYYINKA